MNWLINPIDDDADGACLGNCSDLCIFVCWQVCILCQNNHAPCRGFVPCPGQTHYPVP
jgi:hypothetical protein